MLYAVCRRHEKPSDPDDPLANQNLKDRFYGVNDPVADKLMKRYDELPKLRAPDDKTITALYIGALPPAASEQELRYLTTSLDPLFALLFYLWLLPDLLVPIVPTQHSPSNHAPSTGTCSTTTERYTRSPWWRDRVAPSCNSPVEQMQRKLLNAATINSFCEVCFWRWPCDLLCFLF